MPTITDPQAVKFVNEQLRPACDRVISAIRTLRQMGANYSADGIGAMVNPNPTVAAEYVADGSINADGSKGDGRTPLLGYDVDNAMTQANALLAAVTATIENALTKPSVNSQPVF